MSHVIAFVQSYVLNSLWQVPLTAMAAWLIAWLLPASDAAARHRVWVAALVAESLLPVCAISPAFRHSLLALLQRSHGGDALVSVRYNDAIMAAGAGPLPALLFWMTVLYACLVLVLAARLLKRWRGVARLRRGAQALNLQPETAAVLATCCRHFGIEQIAAATSPDIFGPVTIGAMRPLLLLPPRIVTDVCAADLHAALAHEAAHVSRHDYFRNLLYEVLALPVAFHPCLWLTRAALVESREVLCDCVAADLSRGREAYARSLLRLAAALIHAPQARTTHAIGIFDANAFERRIMKLTTAPIVPTASRRVLTAFTCGSIALLAAGSALALHVHVAEPAAIMAAAADHDRPLKVSSGVMAGNALNKVPPLYPPEAKTARIQGAVVLHAIIGQNWKRRATAGSLRAGGTTRFFAGRSTAVDLQALPAEWRGRRCGHDDHRDVLAWAVAITHRSMCSTRPGSRLPHCPPERSEGSHLVLTIRFR